MFDIFGLWSPALDGGEDDKGRSICTDDDGGLERWVSLDCIASGVPLILNDMAVFSVVGDWNGECIDCGIGARGCDGGCIGPLNPG